MAEALTAEAPNAVIADQGLVYCRAPNGEIVSTDASPMEIMKKINHGWQVLNDYGQFGSNVYYMDNPYEPLFQAGGAHELSVQQIIEMGYHLRPPLVPTCDRHVGQTRDHLTHVGRVGAGSAKAQGCWRGARAVRFPQLERIELPPAPDECEFCGRDDFPTQRALKQHQDVMHNDRRQQQALGEAIVSGLHQTGVVGNGNSSLDAQTIATAVAAALQALGYGSRPDPEPEPDDDDQPEAPEAEPEVEDEDTEDDDQPEPEPDTPEARHRARERERQRQRRAALRTSPPVLMSDQN
jgi:hypothetical protein